MHVAIGLKKAGVTKSDAEKALCEKQNSGDASSKVIYQVYEMKTEEVPGSFSVA